MPALLDVQRGIAEAILARRDVAPGSIVACGTIAPEGRLKIYRNTFLATLTTALRLSFPAVLRLVGNDFFEATAHHFIDAEPPKSAYLNLYGSGFASFLRRFPAVESVPYLSDVARLEWAVNCALHAADAAPLDPDRLAALIPVPPERLVLVPHPSIALLQPEFPADAIWRGVLSNDDDALSAIDLSDRPSWLLVERNPRAGVQVKRLPDWEGRFLAALCDGSSLAEATATAAQVEGDVTQILAARFVGGFFVDFSIKPEKVP